MLEKLFALLITLLVGGGAVTPAFDRHETAPSASPTASATSSASPSASASTSPSASPTASPSASPSAPASLTPAASTGPTDACVAAVRKVDAAFHKDHVDLEHLRRDARGRSETIENADRLLRAIREAAVKAIHNAATCAATAKADDEDKDVDENNDVDEAKAEEQSKPDEQKAPRSPKPTVTFTETDPGAIADKAVTMMDLVFDAAKKALPSASPRPHPTAHPDHTHGPR